MLMYLSELVPVMQIRDPFSLTGGAAPSRLSHCELFRFRQTSFLLLMQGKTSKCSCCACGSHLQNLVQPDFLASELCKHAILAMLFYLCLWFSPGGKVIRGVPPCFMSRLSSCA